MSAKPESLIVSKIMTYIKSKGGDCFKVHGSMFQRAGEPDLCGEIPNSKGEWLHLKIEVKTDVGKPTPLQVKRIKDYASRGYYARIVYSYDECKSWLEEITS